MPFGIIPDLVFGFAGIPTLAKEVAPFGVKLCALEPGGMRTDFIGSFIEMRVIEGGSGVTKPITAIF